MMDKILDPMMKRYQMFAWLGFIIVVISFLVAISAGNASAEFFSADKVTREAAASGSPLVLANATRNALTAWVPAFKFLGLGILLGAITMALGVIIKTLRTLGQHVTDIWPKHLKPGTPEKPMSAKLFPMIMMMGWMLLLIGLLWALSLSGTVSDYWNHSIANELNPAQPGSALLSQLATIVATLPWLGFLRMAGMALLFTGITVALTVIIRTLQTQETILTRFADARTNPSG